MSSLNPLSTVRDVQLVADTWVGEPCHRDVVIREAIDVPQRALDLILVEHVDLDVRIERWLAEHSMRLEAVEA